MICNNRLKSRALLAIFALGFSTAAFAATADGTVTFAFSNVNYSAAGTLMPTSLFSIGSMAVTGSGTGTFDCTTITTNSVCDSYSASLSANPFEGDNMIGFNLIFSGGLSDTPQYEFTVTSQLPPIIIPGLQTFYNIQTNGMFTDLRGSGGFDMASASLGITLIQSCVPNAGCSVQGSAVFSTPPAFSVATPEPGTLGFLGLGLAGIAYFSRKKRRRT